ncbi:MAG: hypothetical protein MJ156_01185 [Alphaproteobacteria bacterium]|nr:hypothetical protein [Alphaproteobacteria bacterium]
MKKSLLFFIVTLFVMPSVSFGAVTIKKQSSVAVKPVEKVESATSLLPNVLGLIQNVKTLNAKQQQLTAECAPTSEEIKTVNELVKEWAKMGTVSADDAARGLGNKCPNGSCYQTEVDILGIDDFNTDPSFDWYASESEKNMIWYGYPKASTAKVCENGSKNCKYVSNIYDIFALMDFDTEDYTKTELSKVNKLIEKSEKCAPEKLAAAKRELYGGFLTQAIGGIGQKTNTGSVLEQVSSVAGSMGGGNALGGITSIIPSLGQMAIQGLDK